MPYHEWTSRTTHSTVLPSMLGMITEGGAVRMASSTLTPMARHASREEAVSLGKLA
jgi:hypothetical protein